MDQHFRRPHFRARRGKGPPLLLLHGFSSTHVMWHPVASQLADKFTLIIADLPGYGWSDMPRSDASIRPTPSARWQK
jgi:haloacetate dehalogenase